MCRDFNPLVTAQRPQTHESRQASSVWSRHPHGMRRGGGGGGRMHNLLFTVRVSLHEADETILLLFSSHSPSSPPPATGTFCSSLKNYFIFLEANGSELFQIGNGSRENLNVGVAGRSRQRSMKTSFLPLAARVWKPALAASPPPPPPRNRVPMVEERSRWRFFFSSRDCSVLRTGRERRFPRRSPLRVEEQAFHRGLRPHAEPPVELGWG